MRVAIPADISAVMDADMPLAVAWREATRETLTHYLDAGFEVREVVRRGELSYYILTDAP